MPFCFFNNGFSFGAVAADYKPKAGEAIFPSNSPTDNELEAAFPDYNTAKAKTVANTAILVQISALELTQTPRRLREAIAGTDEGWLANLESEIAALRGQIV